MNRIKPAVRTVRNSVAANKTRILGTVAVVSTTVAVLQRVGLNQHDEFLKEHGLFDAFYTPED